MATLVQRSCSCMMAWGVLHQKPSKGPHIPPSCSSSVRREASASLSGEASVCPNWKQPRQKQGRQARSLHADHTRRLPKHTELTRNRPQDPIGTLRVADWLVDFRISPLIPPSVWSPPPPRPSLGAVV